MSSWNYRVTRRYITNAESHVFEIREVYYEDDGSIKGFTTGSSSPMGENLTELKADTAMMMAAFTRPIIDIDSDPPQEI
jgi:hypothetical protein